MPNYEISEHTILKSGSQIINLRGGLNTGDAIVAVIKYVTASNDYQFYNGTQWVSMSGFKSEALNADAAGLVSTLDGLKADGTAYQFRSIKAGSGMITITKNASNQIEINLGSVPISAITNLQAALDGKAAVVHEHASSDVTALTNYVIGTVGAYLAPTDTLNVALGKLEYRIKNQFVSSIDFNATTQKITFKNLAGAEIGNVDLVLESVIQDIDYNTTTKTLTITLVDGSTSDIPLTDLIDVYTGVDGAEIAISISNNAISAVLKNGTIAKTRLTTALQTEITNKAENTQTIGTTTESETQVGTGSLTILSILQTFAKNIKALLAWKTSVNLQKTYVSSPLTGQSGTITAATHGVTNPKIVLATLAGANMIIYTKIDSTTKNVTWTSQTNFISGDNAIITIIG